MNSKECIIFGTGSSGEMAYYKLKDKYRIIAYSDNNKEKWNDLYMDIPIICPEKIREYDNDTEIYVASQYYKEICVQLENMGMVNIKYFDEGLVCEYQIKERLACKPDYYKRKLKKILVVQKRPCIRTYRVSLILKEFGIQVDLAYFINHPSIIFPGLQLPWTNIFPVNDLNEFMDFVNKSDYDLIHSSNEPDTITALLVHSNKKIVHDIHDMETFRSSVNFDKRILEKIAVTYSDAVMTAGNHLKEYITRYYHLNNKKIFALGNYPLKLFKPKQINSKLSQIDNEIHCVYEGSINTENKNLSHRSFENIFLDIAKQNVHMHFYSNSNDVSYLKYLETLHPYIHYEGNKSHMDLITELTKYDIGLLSYNLNMDTYKQVIYSLPNKLFDYLSAGIPVAVSDVIDGIKLVNEYNVGRELIFDKKLKEQLIEISKLKVDYNFLEENELTMDFYKDELIKFYESII